MLRAIRLRHGRRRRFRDRVLMAMLAVALVPLVIFVVVVAADLGSVSGTTVENADKAILDDAKQTQQTELNNAAGTFATKIDQLSLQVRGLSQQVAAALKATPDTAAGNPPAAVHVPALTAAVAPISHAVAMSYAAESTSTVIVTGAPPAATPAPDVAAAYSLTASVVAQMETGLSARGVRNVWVAETTAGIVRVVPPVDVASDVTEGRLSSRGPLNPPGNAPFSALAQRSTDTAESPTWGGEAASPQQVAPQTHFTAAYPTGARGVIGMTAWTAVEGTAYRVGVDVDVRQLLGDIASPVSDQPLAYAVLLDAQGTILGGGQDAVTDFGLDATNWVGTKLVPGDAALRTSLGVVLGSGTTSTGSTANVLEATLGGKPKVILTSPIGAAHWVLASVVPKEPLLPKQPVLERGVNSGVQRIFRDAIFVAIGLCVLAFILASLLARRVVGPMRALTAAAERLGSGDIDAPVPAQGRDEVGLLAVHLERMRKEVNASRDGIMAAARELEGRVAERTSELRDRNEELVALNALAGSLTRSLDPEVILQGALDTLRAVVPVVASTAFVLEQGVLVARASWVADGELGVDALAGAARDAVDSHDLVLRPGDHGALVGLPLQTRDGGLGAIALIARPGWQLGGRSRALIRAIADQVGLALRTAALSAEGRELAVLEERTRLAREIHDTIAQQLTAIVLQLEAAEAFVSRDEGRARGVIVTARHLARSALQEARQSVWNLRPTSLQQTGIAGALTMEVGRWQRRTGIPTSLHTGDIPRALSLPPQTEVALFRIVQEALTNVAKHSGASSVDVRLELGDDDVCLFIRDDGEGFEVDDCNHPGAFGLVGMEERARLIGATLTIASAPGHGTEVLVRLPLPEPTEQAEEPSATAATA
jgi:signal transduction histidine kinase